MLPCIVYVGIILIFCLLFKKIKDIFYFFFFFKLTRQTLVCILYSTAYLQYSTTLDSATLE